MTSVDRDEAEATSAQRKSAMDTVIETLAGGLGNSIGWMADHGILFGIFGLAWIAFALGVIWSQGSLDQTWQSIRDLPILVQIAVWILFLPVVVGLWVWETTWPLILRLTVVLGIAGWNLLVFLPRASETVAR